MKKASEIQSTEDKSKKIIIEIQKKESELQKLRLELKEIDQDRDRALERAQNIKPEGVEEFKLSVE